MSWLIRKVGRDEWLLLVEEGRGPLVTWTDAPELATEFFNGRPAADHLCALCGGVAVICERVDKYSPEN